MNAPMQESAKQDYLLNAKFYGQVQFFICAAIFWAMLITAMRALRLPNDWATVHWLLNYEHGFIKRGLIGSLLRPLLEMESLTGHEKLLINTLSVIFFLLFFGVLFGLSVRIFKRTPRNILVFFMVMLFATSSYIVMSAHLVGYFDNILILLTVLACYLVSRGRLIAASVVLSAGMFVHEAILFVGIPSVLFYAILLSVRKTSHTAPLKILAEGLFANYVLLIFPVLCFLSIVFNQTFFVESGTVSLGLSVFLEKYDFVPEFYRKGVPIEITTSFFEYLTREYVKFFDRITKRVYVFSVLLPSLFVVWGVWRLLRGYSNRSLVVGLLLVCSFLPLLLHLIAFDTARIWSFTLVITFLGLWSISSVLGEHFKNIQASASLLLAFCALLLMQIFANMKLMDNLHERYDHARRALYYAPFLFVVWRYLSARFVVVDMLDRGFEIKGVVGVVGGKKTTEKIKEDRRKLAQVE